MFLMGFGVVSACVCGFLGGGVLCFGSTSGFSGACLCVCVFFLFF